MIREERNALFLLLAFAAAAGLLYLLILQPGLDRAQRPSGKRAAQSGAPAPPADNRPKAVRRMVSLTAELRDAATGVPLRAAQATVLDVSDIAEPAVAVDEAGLLRIEFLPPEITFGLEIACAGHVTRAFSRLRADAKEIIDLGLVTLAPLRRIAGAVTAPGGRPAQGCAVSVFRLEADCADADPLRRAAHLSAALLGRPAASTESGEDGSFSVEGLAAGSYAVYVVGRPHGSVLLTGVDVELEDRQLRVELLGGYPVQGRIAVAGAGPLAEGTVLLLEAGPPLARRLSAAYCRTDAAGFFAHHALSPRPHFLFVAGAAAASTGCGPFLFPYGEELDITAAAGLAASGVVLDGNRLPVKNALVTARSEAPGQIAVSAATDEKGRFRVTGLAQGVAELQVDAPGYALDRTRLEVRPPGAEVR
ncbi:MAG: carboxypeptidase regulatory-like domain-containing protein, partial [Planctomycetes bacterium]|nr:carboxypeptidase regulatory-like domain-containing protein [Planctomycetota bacterium]